MAAPSGPPTSLGIRTFADSDSPDLGPNGLGLILGDVNAAIVAGGIVQRIAEGLVGSGGLAAPAASIDFSGIPATYRHLLAIWAARSDGAASVLRCHMAGDAGGNYDDAFGYVSTAGAFSGVGGVALSSIRVGWCSGTSDAAGMYASGVVLVADYTATRAYKATVSLSMNPPASFAGGRWNGAAAALARLTFYPDVGSFVAGSRVTLYGIG